MDMLILVLYVAALVLFLASSFGVAIGRVSLGWLGAALVTLAVLLTGYPS